MRPPPFTDRVDAGRQLGHALTRLRGGDVVVLGLPRGGVPVAAEVAAALGAPLDVIVVRKLGVPSRPELAMGAIGEDGVRVVNRSVLDAIRIGPPVLDAVEQAERVELARRVRVFRGDRPRVPLVGRTAVIVDDGMATGATAAVACRVARALGATSVFLAVPVGSREAVARLRAEADQVICLETPWDLASVGQFYVDFRPTRDEEVVSLLTGAPPATADHAEEVEIPVGTVLLPGLLTVPATAAGIVVFAHGSGSGRHSPRNRFVAGELNRSGLGTLLFDLLTPAEAADRATVFDVRLLAGRLGAATHWLRAERRRAELWTGYFGASTGAGAALWAAAEPGAGIAAVVSRGGRPDLAMSRLGQVTAPTLLIVGGDDPAVLDLNRRAQAALRCENSLAIVPGATHLFSEPGALAEVVRLATGWFGTRAGGSHVRAVH